MEKYNLIWIVPLCIILGFSLGLYYSIPQEYTIDYGENMKYIIDEMKDMDLDINNSDCPDCICNNDVPRYSNEVLLNTINKNVIKLQNKEVFETPTVVYYIEEYVGNCSDDRQVAKSKENLERIEKSISKTNIHLDNIQEGINKIEDSTFDIKQDMTNLFRLE